MNIKHPEKDTRTNQSEIRSLIYLLDDPDPDVQQQVQSRLMTLGEQAIPLLDQYATHSHRSGQQEQIQRIIRRITSGSIEQEFINIVDQGGISYSVLEKAMFVLSKFDKPTIRPEHYQRELDDFAEVLQLKIRRDIEAPVYKTVIAYLFHSEGFTGSEQDYFDPQNSYIHRVIERRTGIPISLSMVTLFVARRIGLPFYGINLPMHFLLQYDDGTKNILIDPFNNGTIVTEEQCIYFLKKNGIQPTKSHFQPATPYDILSRTLRNLINCYNKKDDQESVASLNKLLNLLEASQLNYR